MGLITRKDLTRHLVATWMRRLFILYLVMAFSWHPRIVHSSFFTSSLRLQSDRRGGRLVVAVVASNSPRDLPRLIWWSLIKLNAVSTYLLTQYLFTYLPKKTIVLESFAESTENTRWVLHKQPLKRDVRELACLALSMRCYVECYPQWYLIALDR